jgi:hypothetical protein
MLILQMIGWVTEERVSAAWAEFHPDERGLLKGVNHVITRLGTRNDRPEKPSRVLQISVVVNPQLSIPEVHYEVDIAVWQEPLKKVLGRIFPVPEGHDEL